VSTTRRTETEIRKILAAELVGVAKRQLPTVFRDRGADQENFPMTARIMSRLEPEMWESDPTRALLVVMRRAVQLLPDETAEQCREGYTWQQVGKTLYFGKEIDASLADYGSFLRRAKADSGVSWRDRTFGRIIPHKLRDMLADILLNLKKSPPLPDIKQVSLPSSLPTAMPSDTPSDTTYVSRDSLESRFYELAQPGAIILLYGEAGTGKTILAKHLIAQSSRSYTIRASNLELLHDDLYGTLRAEGVQVSGGERELRYAFKELLASTNAPPYILIDDVIDPQIVSSVLPPSLSSVVLLTSQLLHLSIRYTNSMRISSMHQQESYALLRQFLPDVSEDEAGVLYSVTGGRALILSQAGAYLRQYSDISIEDFCEVLKRYPAHMSSTMSEADRPIGLIYEQITAALRKQMPIAYEIVRAICLTENLTYEGILTAYALKRHPMVVEFPTVAEVEVEQAYIHLQNINLIQRSRMIILMHPFTQVLLRDLLRNDFKDVWEPLMEACQAVRHEYRKTYEDAADRYNLSNQDYRYEWDRRYTLWVVMRCAWRNKLPALKAEIERTQSTGGRP
jgi:hypothetical protein